MECNYTFLVQQSHHIARSQIETLASTQMAAFCAQRNIPNDSNSCKYVIEVLVVGIEGAGSTIDSRVLVVRHRGCW